MLFSCSCIDSDLTHVSYMCQIWKQWSQTGARDKLLTFHLKLMHVTSCSVGSTDLHPLMYSMLPYRLISGSDCFWVMWITDERTFLLTIIRLNVFEGRQCMVDWVSMFLLYSTNTMDRLRSRWFYFLFFVLLQCPCTCSLSRCSGQT